jgi:hypothetical protein
MSGSNNPATQCNNPKDWNSQGIICKKYCDLINRNLHPDKAGAQSHDILGALPTTTRYRYDYVIAKRKIFNDDFFTHRSGMILPQHRAGHIQN